MRSIKVLTLAIIKHQKTVQLARLKILILDWNWIGIGMELNLIGMDFFHILVVELVET